MSKLEIWVDPAWKDHPKINELREKDHTIRSVDDIGLSRPDLILHPNAWRWDDTKWDFLDVALKEARRGQPKRTNPPKAGAKPRRRKGLKGAAGE